MQQRLIVNLTAVVAPESSTLLRETASRRSFGGNVLDGLGELVAESLLDHG